MFAKLVLVLLFAFPVSYGFNQDANTPSKKFRRANILINTFEGLDIKGGVVNITLDYILIDAKRFNSPEVLSAYYIRNEGPYYKIEVQHIKLVIETTSRNMARSALGSAAAGAIVAGEVAANNLTNESELTEFVYATAAGVGVGGLAGIFKGLFHVKKRILILGNAIKLIELLNYYTYVTGK